MSYCLRSLVPQVLAKVDHLVARAHVFVSNSLDPLRDGGREQADLDISLALFLDDG